MYLQASLCTLSCIIITPYLCMVLHMYSDYCHASMYACTYVCMCLTESVTLHLETLVGSKYKHKYVHPLFRCLPNKQNLCTFSCTTSADPVQALHELLNSIYLFELEIHLYALVAFSLLYAVSCPLWSQSAQSMTILLSSAMRPILLASVRTLQLGQHIHC